MVHHSALEQISCPAITPAAGHGIAAGNPAGLVAQAVSARRPDTLGIWLIAGLQRTGVSTRPETVVTHVTGARAVAAIYSDIYYL